MDQGVIYKYRGPLFTVIAEKLRLSASFFRRHIVENRLMATGGR